MKRLTGFGATLAAFGVLALASTAQAQSGPARAWAEAKNALPTGPKILVGINLETIRSSQIYKQFVPKLIEKEADVKEGFALVKAKCNLDAAAVIQGVVVAVDDKEKGVIFLSLKGVDEAGVSDCLAKVAAAKDSKTKVTAKKVGNLVEYTAAGEKDKLYVAWLGKDVVAISTQPNESASLQKMLAGKGALAKSADFVRPLGKVNTNAALWGIVAKPDDLGNGVKMKLAYGSADITSGKISAELNIVTGSPKEASDAAAKANTELDQAKKSGQVPPALAGAMNSVKVTAAGDAVVVTGSILEKDILSMLQMFMPK